MHGHNYVLEVEVEGSVAADGVVLWYEEIDTVALAWIDQVDHYTVLALGDDSADGADVVRCPTGEPSAENLATWAWRDICQRLRPHVSLASLRLWETSRSWVCLP